MISAADLKWTAIRPGGLTNFRNNKETIVSIENQPKPSITITRHSIAAFMLDILEQERYIKQKPVISGR